jgi:hypothetical protein
MAKTCIFCGQRPESKTKEHVIPKWLIAMTGDPKRQVSFGTYNINDKPPTKLAFDQLTFPACEQCNGKFSDLEGRARKVTERLLEKMPLTSSDFNCLLDWLDKVRTGMWLGLLWLDGNPWGIEPNFHITSRLRLHDRSVGIGLIEGRHPGINLVGPESPCFGLLPTTMCIFINELALFNSSTIGLCSRRLGFPFFRLDDFSIRRDGLIEAAIAPGLERVLRPVERIGLLQSQPFVYQPVFVKGVDGDTSPAYNTDYVRENSYDFDAGLGALFLQRSGEVSKFEEDASNGWIPDAVLSLTDAYRTGMRWAYRKLEQDYEAQARGDWSRLPFSVMHKRIIRGFDKKIGL